MRRESNSRISYIVDYFKCSLLHIANDPQAINLLTRKCQAVIEEDPRYVEIQCDSIEVQRYFGDCYGLVASEVITGIKQSVSRLKRVRRHVLPERRPQGLVGRRREASDRSAGVQYRATGPKNRWRNGELLPGHADSDQVNEVEAWILGDR